MDTLDQMLMKMDVKQLAKILLAISIIGILAVALLIYIVISNSKKVQKNDENKETRIEQKQEEDLQNKSQQKLEEILSSGLINNISN